MAYQTWPSTHLVNILIGSSLLYTCMHPIHTYTLHTCTHYTCTHYTCTHTCTHICTHYTCTHYTCTHYTCTHTSIHTRMHTFKFSRSLKIFVQSGHSTNFISTSCTQNKMNGTQTVAHRTKAAWSFLNSYSSEVAIAVMVDLEWIAWLQSATPGVLYVRRTNALAPTRRGSFLPQQPFFRQSVEQLLNRNIPL